MFRRKILKREERENQLSNKWDDLVERLEKRFKLSERQIKIIKEGPEDKPIARLFSRLIWSYETTENRRYHDYIHIYDCLTECEQILIKQREEIEMAIWFHDVVYDTERSDNEERSAKFAFEALKEIEMPERFIQTVVKLILATKHDKKPRSLIAKIITDIDLAILGKSPQEFDEYEKEIRGEYSWVPEDQFKSKRADILKGFLNRSSIYYTTTFQQKYEKQARENLERSLNSLLN